MNNITFQLFLTMERCLRTIVSAAPFLQHPGPVKCVEDIKEDEDVQCVWSLISIDWSESCADALLEKILSEWIKIRGFSYASAYVEKLKCKECKSTQKSKVLRKQLQSVQSTAKKAKLDE